MMRDSGQFQISELEPSLFRLVRRKLLIAACVVGAATGAGCLWVVLQPRPVPIASSAERVSEEESWRPLFEMDAAAYEEGKARAAHDLDTGKAVKLTYGLISELLDEETGLEVVTLGCCVDDADRSYVAGYQDAVRDFVDKHGVPSNSHKCWSAILLSLNDYFESRIAATQPEWLDAGGTIYSPHDRTAVTLCPTSPIGDLWQERGYSSSMVQQETETFWTLRVNRGSEPTVEIPWGLAHDRKGLRCLWGPAGSDFLIVKSAVNGQWACAAFSLRTGRLLRVQKCAVPTSRSD